MLTNLDMDVLRTLLTVIETGSFTRAATLIGRSQSAVSLQITKLERQIGRPIFELRRAQNGGGLKLTGTGEMILDYARRILALNDEAIATARGVGAEGTVRLGMAQDIAETWLPIALARFARTHPGILVEGKVGRSAALLDALDQGDLDIALVFSIPGDASRRDDCHWRTELPIIWIGPPGWRVHAGLPVPLVMFEPPCLFRNAAQAAIDKAGLTSRMAFQSPSLAGMWSAVAAGLGITIRTPMLVPKGLDRLKPKTSGLPVLPNVEFLMHMTKTSSCRGATQIAEVIIDTLETSVRSAAI